MDEYLDKDGDGRAECAICGDEFNDNERVAQL
jgi:hypothetical protein